MSSDPDSPKNNAAEEELTACLQRLTIDDKEKTWRELQQWARTQKQQNGLTWVDFLFQLNLPPKSTFVQYLASSSLVPSQKEGTTGAKLREALHQAKTSGQSFQRKTTSTFSACINDWFLDQKNSYEGLVSIEGKEEESQRYEVIVNITRRFEKKKQQSMQEELSKHLKEFSFEPEHIVFNFIVVAYLSQSVCIGQGGSFGSGVYVTGPEQSVFLLTARHVLQPCLDDGRVVVQWNKLQLSSRYEGAGGIQIGIVAEQCLHPFSDIGLVFIPPNIVANEHFTNCLAPLVTLPCIALKHVEQLFKHQLGELPPLHVTKHGSSSDRTSGTLEYFEQQLTVRSAHCSLFALPGDSGALVEFIPKRFNGNLYFGPAGIISRVAVDPEQLAHQRLVTRILCTWFTDDILEWIHDTMRDIIAEMRI